MPKSILHAILEKAVCINGVLLGLILRKPLSEASIKSSYGLKTHEATYGACRCTHTQANRFDVAQPAKELTCRSSSRLEGAQNFSIEEPHIIYEPSVRYYLYSSRGNNGHSFQQARPKNSPELHRQSSSTSNRMRQAPISPSISLVKALEAIQAHQAVPYKNINKADLSAISPATVQHRRKGVLDRSRLQPQLDESQRVNASDHSLQGILSNYIFHLHDRKLAVKSLWDREAPDQSLERALLQAFNGHALSYLHRKGYDATDVMVWAWILTAESARRAALRLRIITHKADASTKSTPKNVPTFVFMFLLRRQQIDAQALKWLLGHAWSLLEGRYLTVDSFSVTGTTVDYAPTVVNSTYKNVDVKSPAYVPMNESTVMTMVVRLLRHARRVWPPAVISITAIAIAHISGNSSLHTSPNLPTRTIARLTYYYNRILSLLALPSSLQPFLSMTYHQRAQFDLLKHMVTFDPPLSISREGYRAVTKVQLAHKKTVSERQWAEMKAKSWPPWKKEKLGLDVHEGIDLGMSRALESMTRMKEAGYPGSRWEKLAAIIAGCDTDMSPTIQTRAIFTKAPTSLDAEYFQKWSKGDLSAKDARDRGIWASRILATRTVHEAWACFLACGDSGTEPSESMYAVMFEKLVFDYIRQRRAVLIDSRHGAARQSDSMRIYPGDGKEVSSAPLSPQEAVYVRCEPPSLTELFEQMVKRGITPSTRSLAFIVSHAFSVAAGQKFLRLSGVRGAYALADYGVVSQHSSSVSELSFVPDQVFAAFIKLLCRFNRSSLGQTHNPAGSKRNTAFESIREMSRSPKHQPNPIMHALRLVDVRRPRYRPCWNALLSAFARSDTNLHCTNAGEDNPQRDILRWNLLQKIVEYMRQSGVELDSDGFQKVCMGLEKAILTSIRCARSAGGKIAMDHTIDVDGDAGAIGSNSRAVRQSLEVLHTGHKVISGYFRNLVGSKVTSTPESSFLTSVEDSLKPYYSVPTLLTVPGPSQLHAYIRILGLSQNHTGILALIKWMARYATELSTIADASGSGKDNFRRALVSARVFLERSSQIALAQDERNSPMCFSEASKELRDQVKSTVVGVDSWGGWPDDGEIAFYMQRESFF